MQTCFILWYSMAKTKTAGRRQKQKTPKVIIQDAFPRVLVVLGYWSQERQCWRLQPASEGFLQSLEPTYCLSLQTESMFYCCDKKQQYSKPCRCNKSHQPDNVMALYIFWSFLNSVEAAETDLKVQNINGWADAFWNKSATHQLSGHRSTL